MLKLSSQIPLEPSLPSIVTTSGWDQVEVNWALTPGPLADTLPPSWKEVEPLPTVPVGPCSTKEMPAIGASCSKCRESVCGSHWSNPLQLPFQFGFACGAVYTM